MTERMDVLRRDYLPEELRVLLQQTQVDGTIAVQARQMIQETEWLLQLAEQFPFIKGVVGWVDLRSRGVVKQLHRYAAHPKLVGVRHVLHDEPDDRLMLRPEFVRGLAALRPYGLTYDLLLFPRHLSVAAQLVAQFPEQPFVLDHIAKPAIRDRRMSPWRENLHSLARFPKVYCKLSGLVTECEWGRWQAEDFHAYLDVVLEAFGPERVMFGSDWPVCTLSGSYQAVLDIILGYLEQFPSPTREQILGGNCARFYSLDSTKPRA